MGLREEVVNTVNSWLGRQDARNLVYSPELRQLYDSGLIDDNDIEHGLRSLVFENSRRDYRDVLSGGIAADHLLDPAILAYAINDRFMFSPEERQALPLEHGDTVEDFCRENSDPNLFDKLKKQLLEKATNVQGESRAPDCTYDSDPEHPSCLCC